MKLQLNKFDKIIFDMDGVITSELAYWQTAALSVYDLLVDYEHYGKCGIDREWLRKNYVEVFNIVMCGGKTISAVKSLGVNTNWDLVYIIFCVSKYLNADLETLDEAHFKSVCMFIENIDLKAPRIYDALCELIAPLNLKEDNFFKRGGDYFWKEIYDNFAMWYIGTDEFSGVMDTEELLFSPSELIPIFEKLNQNGIRLGIGTGRPASELERPLKKFGLDKYFDKKLSVTYDDVIKAEEKLKPKIPFAKPDPFVFLKAALGEKYSDKEIVEGNYSIDELSRTLIIGDAASDLLAAQKGGFQFLAVLTGIDGENARSFFVENKADYIVSNVLSIKNYFEE